MEFSLPRKRHFILVAKLLLVLFPIFIIFLLINYFYLRWRSYDSVLQELHQSTDHILADIEYKNGEWNIEPYIQDSTTDTDKPLYIFTTEGFVIERMNPIKGYLDTSNIEYIQSLTEAQTITTDVNTTWRVVSQPIIQNSQHEGSVLVAYYKPQNEILYAIDLQLKQYAEEIVQQIKFKNDEIIADDVTSKNFPHNIYFSVVDKFNHVLAEEGGPPSYIDRSYVEKLLKTKSATVSDSQLRSNYIVITKPIIREGKTIGVIAEGKNIDTLEQILQTHRNFLLFSATLTLLLSTLFIAYIFGGEVKRIITEKADEIFESKLRSSYLNPAQISFDKKYSQIILDATCLPIEYGSIQYDLCSSLFSAPKKRWEHDELMDKNKLSDEDYSHRIFYDAAKKINAKITKLLGMHLIEYRDKTFFLNPVLLTKLQ